MADIGAFLSSEEHQASALVDQARMAEEAGMHSVLISDHFHPWLDVQGESPFVWSVIGAISAKTQHAVMTGVTCPTIRIHPAILAHAAATSQVLLNGRFVLGVGSGEALNEHILGDKWPPVATRLEMLEEAVELMRELWTGRVVSRYGQFFTVENARLYSLPDEAPPIVVSGFGPEAVDVAARIGDGFVTTKPDAELLSRYRDRGGKGSAFAALKVCWDPDEARARKLAHQLWPTEAVEGQLNQELPMPSHLRAAAAHVTEDMVAELIPCGPDPERHAAAITRYLDAGFDHVYINQVGPDQEGFFQFYARELSARLQT